MNDNFNNISFKKRISIKQIEEGNDFCPKFNHDGLLPCITTEYETQVILMFSYINEQALKKTIYSKKAHYFSRSRKDIWLKGETSGMFHNIINIYVDDDQDCLIYEVKLNKPTKGGEEASCHVGYKSCFYRKVKITNKKASLEFTENKKAFDPNVVYKGIENPTKI